ncbi:sensor histidine kinase [Saccharothrix coeruleofusca]|uniref:histidine kinase n=1 Tax=Saccharothrix coeruleofusca TaxID=33919 RepID=A0A918ARM1_9PSEU|nr:histidine kinase [Saccharothrix coeruleofusca]GGP78377.1 hypothetical protein GCM10010185_60150 [Saccharothrix coeruleofusca]
MITGQHWWLSRASAADVALAVSAAILDVLLFSTFSRHPATNASAAVALAFAGVGLLALSARRRRPVAVFAVVWTCAALAAPVSGIDFRPTATPCVALFTVALRARTPVAVGALAATGPLAVLAALLESGSRPAEGRAAALYGTLAFYLVLYGCAWAAGRWVRMSRQHADDLAFRRRAEAREAVLEERTRIARELHDIVARSVTVMVLQAANARRVLDSDQGRVREALGHIEESGEQAMGELRRMLTALRPDREDAEATADGPQPGLADVAHLVAAASAAGVRVRTRVEGVPRGLAASVDLAAYRVVQEALTNVTKHVGPGADAEVRLCWDRDELTVAVVDDGRGLRPGRAVLPTDHGLLGLRERLAVVGGTLAAGPVAGGGFRVTAVLPTAEPRPAEARPAEAHVGEEAR